MKHSCLEEKSFMDICYDTPSGTLREFLRYGDKVLSFISEDDFTAICADQNRKADIEEQMIEEESYELQA